MEFYLLDTNFVSVLFDPRRPNYAAVVTAAATVGSEDAQFISTIVMAELRYGMAAAEKAGKAVDHIRHTIEQAEEYAPAEINRHTAEAYADVKSRMAAHYINIGAKAPRWFEDWQISASSKTLQVDENDLWLVSQAVERNYMLMTTDGKLVERFTPVIPELRCQLIS